jgi:hypothetical protein
MPSIAWLAVALVAGVAAYLVGWPAWQSSRSRVTRDTNAERYLAWRGRAVRGQSGSRASLTDDERRRLYAAAALAMVSVLALVAFFATS